MLCIEDLHVHYGRVHALKGISLTVREGEIVALIGNNGAGKSTLLTTISGLMRPTSGSIRLRDREIGGLPAEQVIRLGISQAQEGRRLFDRSSVMENLEMGAYIRHDRAGIARDIETYCERFPILRERRRQLAGTLSGGEQQMLCIARALMCRPQLLMLDEPSLGLMPKLVTEVLNIITSIRQDGVTILLVEQNARKAFGICDRAYVLESGRMVLEGTADELRRNDMVRKVYLGEE
jgi:branched-chain amino acid transport system ATP-binding protein